MRYCRFSQGHKLTSKPIQLLEHSRWYYIAIGLNKSPFQNLNVNNDGFGDIVVEQAMFKYVEKQLYSTYLIKWDPIFEASVGQRHKWTPIFANSHF